MQREASKRHARPIDFGEARFANAELLPLAAGERRLQGHVSSPLWMALAATPGVYGAAARAPSLLAGLVAVTAGLAAGIGVAHLLSWGATRLGVGSVPVLRATFGTRGAIVPLLLRWVCGIGFGVAWILELAPWMATFLLSFARDALGTRYLASLPYFAVVLVLAVAFVAAAFAAARWSLAKLAQLIVGATLTVLGSGVALIVMGGIASKGFGGPRPGGYGILTSFAPLAGGVFVYALPAALGVTDWWRYSRGAYRISLLERFAPLIAVLLGLAAAFVGGLLARAALTLHGQFHASAIADAAGVAGVAAATLGCLLSLTLFAISVPLVSFYGSSLALLGAVPRLKQLRRAMLLSAVMLLGGTIAFLSQGLYGRGSVVIEGLLVVLASLAGVSLADVLLIRRGRLVLEELYLARSMYGPWFGVALSPFFAMLVGLSLHPLLGEHVWRGHTGNLATWILQRLGAHLGMVVVSASVYVPLRLLENAILALVQGRWKWRLFRNVRTRRPRFLRESSVTEQLKGARFLNDPRADESQKW